jgi:hypothetical protein
MKDSPMGVVGFSKKDIQACEEFMKEKELKKAEEKAADERRSAEIAKQKSACEAEGKYWWNPTIGCITQEDAAERKAKQEQEALKRKDCESKGGSYSSYNDTCEIKDNTKPNEQNNSNNQPSNQPANTAPEISGEFSNLCYAEYKKFFGRETTKLTTVSFDKYSSNMYMVRLEDDRGVNITCMVNVYMQPNVVTNMY